ncbi:MAG: glycosyltransferase, partial [Deltaproteobacteria bacterium]|nr:glycosyltransferase [Deltaproteobacteria bacterium]
IVYLEAMRFGLPVIAGDAGGPREIVSHGVNGYLAPPGDPATLARYLKSMLENRDLLARMSLAALTQAASQPTWEDSAAKVRGFLYSFENKRSPQRHREHRGTQSSL